MTNTYNSNVRIEMTHILTHTYIGLWLIYMTHMYIWRGLVYWLIYIQGNDSYILLMRSDGDDSHIDPYIYRDMTHIYDSYLHTVMTHILTHICIGLWDICMTLIKRTPPPRGGFLFTMFPDQEPCVRDFTTRCDRRISSWNFLHTALDQGT